MVFGIISCLPLKRRPLASLSSFLIFQCGMRMGFKAFLCVGKPSAICVFSTCSASSLAVSSFICFDFSGLAGISWITRCAITSMSSLSGISSTVSFRYARDCVSAMNINFPGTKCTVRLYFWSLINNRWILGGVWDNGFVTIASSGLWSLWKSMSFLYTNWWNCLHAKVMANCSCSIWA